MTHYKLLSESFRVPGPEERNAKERAELLQLPGDGPYVTPTVEGFLWMGIPPGSSLSQLCLLLEGGKELRLPVTPEARKEILRKLASCVPDPKATPE
jgi:hypothetical protein